MRKLVIGVLAILVVIVIVSFNNSSPLPTPDSELPTQDTILYPDETHFKNIQQLTFGGDNAEAYWSYDGKYIVFQRTNAKEGLPCDQIFMGKVPAAR